MFDWSMNVERAALLAELADGSRVLMWGRIGKLDYRELEEYDATVRRYVSAPRRIEVTVTLELEASDFGQWCSQVSEPPRIEKQKMIEQVRDAHQEQGR